ncbi:MAG: 50S ribosomal protein L31 [Bdellovibrionales bacterium RIFOXYB2_FULL_36_6]|nr:MAG: 50S ribosomal protein L31 [Bdellovibrionales bacterium RIFOXYB2_FULL_36_6]
MKKDIHPKSYETTITCACGNSIPTKTTIKDIKIEICSSCHPFFTGTTKMVATQGRIEHFNKKYQKYLETKI